jgi:hypothetical protein
MAPTAPIHAALAAFSIAMIAALPAPLAAQAGTARAELLISAERAGGRCVGWLLDSPQRNPNADELRCRHEIDGPGRFGLLWHLDVPAYQPATPLPGTHVVGIEGMPRPMSGESYEAWEWRVLRTEYGPAVRSAHRGLEVLDPFFAARLLELEQRLREAGVRFTRRETWRSPQRQAFIFQQGRSRPGPLATATLTSWHNVVDARGQPAGLAADYTVPAAQLPSFHALAEQLGLHSYGADSNDPGHVYMPRSTGVDAFDVALLRLLPRVPVVTLATGRPIDESPTATERAAWREASARFAGEPCVHQPRATVVTPAPPRPPLADPAAAKAITRPRRAAR